MRLTLLCIALLAATAISFGASDPVNSTGENAQAVAKDGGRGGEKRIPGRWEDSPIYLAANNMSIATGQPSLVLMSSGSMQIPVWSFSGSTTGQSVAGLLTGLPSGCAAVKVEIIVTTTDVATSPSYEDVYRVHLSQMVEGASFTARYNQGNPVRTALPTAPFYSRTIALESYYEVVPNAPLWVRVQREPDDPADSFTNPTGLAMVKVTPLDTSCAGGERLQLVADDSGHRREAGLRV